MIYVGADELVLKTFLAVSVCITYSNAIESAPPETASKIFSAELKRAFDSIKSATFFSKSKSIFSIFTAENAKIVEIFLTNFFSLVSVLQSFNLLFFLLDF